MSQAATSRAVARIDVGAIQQNCQTIVSRLAPGSSLCAVVKADGYGHGAIAAATAALRGGAQALAVVSAAEGEELRRYLPNTPILVMGALTEQELERALVIGADVGIWRPEFVSVAARIAAGMGRPARIHLKYDTGMSRLGERDPTSVIALAGIAAADANLELAGVWTHFATADEPDRRFMEDQLGAFDAVVREVRAIKPDVVAHAANSAATYRMPNAHYDMVRCGIAIYGLSPFQGDPASSGLVPAMTLASYVAGVKFIEKGTSVGYGRKWKAPTDTWIGVLPIGYGDGVRRALSDNGEVLIECRRYPIVGTVSMDNITVDLGRKNLVKVGDEAVLIGRQGRQQILAEDVARRLDTINYEVTCSIGPRVERERRA